jgi:Na+-transporting NADH:ubiquinone oxidoreductase subunit B
MWNIGYQHHQALGITNVSLMDNFIFGAIKVLP